MSADTFNLEILADGTVKLTTDKVSAANHKNADELLAFLAKQLGGAQTTQKRGHTHSHAHEHEHEHEHE